MDEFFFLLASEFFYGALALHGVVAAIKALEIGQLHGQTCARVVGPLTCVVHADSLV